MERDFCVTCCSRYWYTSWSDTIPSRSRSAAPRRPWTRKWVNRPWPSSGTSRDTSDAREAVTMARPLERVSRSRNTSSTRPARVRWEAKVRRPVAREEDQDEIVLLGGSREKRSERPLEIAESGLPLGPVGEKENVLLLEPALAHQHLVDQLGIRHRVAELGNGRALVRTHPDHHRPLLAVRLGGQHRLCRLHGGRALVHHGAHLLADGAVGLAGADDDGVASFAELDGGRHRDRLLGRALRLLQDLGAVQEHVDRRDALARADLRRHQARLVAHSRAIFRM